MDTISIRLLLMRQMVLNHHFLINCRHIYTCNVIFRIRKVDWILTFWTICLKWISCFSLHTFRNISLTLHFHLKIFYDRIYCCHKESVNILIFVQYQSIRMENISKPIDFVSTSTIWIIFIFFNYSCAYIDYYCTY